ncbi:hypothetical protein B0I35DRAFT_426719 [Stachybotrys elegans]|uniref:Uncharacterized protein n=1 Tax=Stachybotrys elegans TaxID=80388 RepID=A0A8K0WUU5_9HYPO|nr:hypothetical protein B0I35DRAFT_426719 [Stachybotrys elegans]
MHFSIIDAVAELPSQLPNPDISPSLHLRSLSIAMVSCLFVYPSVMCPVLPSASSRDSASSAMRRLLLVCCALPILTYASYCAVVSAILRSINIRVTQRSSQLACQFCIMPTTELCFPMLSQPLK